MKTFETILQTLHNFFIEQLPVYIEKINKEKDDGIILSPFQNKTLFENCQKLPCLKLTFEEANYSEKDRIIENSVFIFNLEIKINNSEPDSFIKQWRYLQAIDLLINENKQNFIDFRIQNYHKSHLQIRITI